MTSTQQQTVTAWRNGGVEQLGLPAPSAEIVPGVCWGRFEDFFTPAFWVARSWIDGENSRLTDYTIGRSLREEVAACLLGGHGMAAELGVAAFDRLRERGLLDGERDAEEIETALCEPLTIQGRQLKYRYPRTKARFVAEAMRKLRVEQPPRESAVALRNWLLSFPGIGPKTASWITRNHLHSDEVAILDVHIVRAGVLMGLFTPTQTVEKNYFDMETRLVEFARMVGVSLAKFDSMVWWYMRELNQMALDAVSALGLEPDRT
jgi:N-glycosylase/DNA lyase